MLKAAKCGNRVSREHFKFWTLEITSMKGFEKYYGNLFFFPYARHYVNPDCFAVEPF